MVQPSSIRAKKPLTFVFSALFIGLLSVSATESSYASSGDGCNPKVWRAMNAKAQAKVAYDVAATEQIIKKPDSVLALTCFNNAAGIAATEGGKIFSGDFKASLAPVIEDALQGFYGNFSNSVGASAGVVDYGTNATTIGTATECNKIQQLWDKVAQTGIEKGAPAVTFRNMLENEMPANAGPEFAANWQAENATMTELNAAVADVPAPENSFTNYSDGATSCEYLQQNGIVSSCD